MRLVVVSYTTAQKHTQNRQQQMLIFSEMAWSTATWVGVEVVCVTRAHYSNVKIGGKIRINRCDSAISNCSARTSLMNYLQCQCTAIHAGK